MDDIAILDHLEALANTLGIEIRYEYLDGETAFHSGGLCRVRDKYFVIVNETASKGEKIQIIARALRRFDLSQIFIKPALRDFLEETVEENE